MRGLEDERMRGLEDVTPQPTITISQPKETTLRKPIEAEDVESSLRVEDSEKELIRKALEVSEGNRKEAAARLGFSERTLYRKIKEYDL